MKTIDIDKRITAIYTTIDNYGTAQEGRADIKQLLSDVLNYVKPARENIPELDSDHLRGHDTAVVQMEIKQKELGL